MARIQWSRLKKMLESRFCARLSGRVQVHMTRYTPDQEVGRMWMVLDKQLIFSVGDYPSPSRPLWYLDKGCVFFNLSWGRSHLEMFLLPYLNLSIEEALASSSEFIRALAMFDKRIGKRRLQLLAEQMENEPLAVRHFYALRCQAQGL